MYESINPYTGEIVYSTQTLALKEAKLVIDHMDHYWQNTWARMSVSARCEHLHAIPAALKSSKDNLASIITLESGKPIAQSRAEIDKCIRLCEWYLQNADRFMQEETIPFTNQKAKIIKQPCGIVFGIMPWNFPFWQVFRFAFPNLLAGNCVVLKPAPEVPFCAFTIEQIFSNRDLFSTLILNNEDIPPLIQMDAICGVTFTGSGSTGMKVAAMAGAALKKVVLELGGSDPAIVFPDSHLENAAKALLFSRLQNNGQTCIASKRWFVHEDIYSTFMDEIIQVSKTIRAGDPFKEENTLSCLISKRIYDGLSSQVSSALQYGATLETLPIDEEDSHQLRFSAGILQNINSQFPIYHEEFFGPISFLEPFKTEEEVAHKANSTRFGLGASVWSTNENIFLSLASKLRTGNVAWNQILSSDPTIPFGGTASSGFGKELGKAGMLEFVNHKSLYL